MNPKFQGWFSQNKVSDALCGFDEFLMEDPTYRGEHDLVLAVGELLRWAERGHESAASLGFEEAIRRLIGRKALMSALRLLRTYELLIHEVRIELSFNVTAVLEMIAAAVNEAGNEVSQNESLRKLVLLVSEQFPRLKDMIGFKWGSKRTSRQVLNFWKEKNRGTLKGKIAGKIGKIEGSQNK
jgi:hypothetical protein